MIPGTKATGRRSGNSKAFTKRQQEAKEQCKQLMLTCGHPAARRYKIAEVPSAHFSWADWATGWIIAACSIPVAQDWSPRMDVQIITTSCLYEAFPVVIISVKMASPRAGRSCWNQTELTNLLITFWCLTSSLLHAVRTFAAGARHAEVCFLRTPTDTQLSSAFWVFLKAGLLVSLLYNMYLRVGRSRSDLLFVSGRSCAGRLARAGAVIVGEEGGEGLRAPVNGCRDGHRALKRGGKQL